MHRNRSLLPLFAALALGAVAALADDADREETDPAKTDEERGRGASEGGEPADDAARGEEWKEEIVVIGTPDDLSRIPGSGQVIPKEELEQRLPSTLNEAVRLVPGLAVRTEDVTGTVPNIGLRGLNPDRSEKMHFLEDGVPSALSPYNENAAYYAAPVERAERIEVLKGSGSILYGPQTVGGVLNLVTPQPLGDDLEGSARLSLGSYGHGVAQADVGRRWDRTSLYFSALHKEGDGFREANDFDVDSLTAKLIHRPTDASFFTLKLNWFDQESRQTYLGLTPWLLENRGGDFNPAPDDRFLVDRLDGQASYRHFLGERGEILVNLFGSKSTRDWNRQDFARNDDSDGDGICAPPPSNTVATFGPEQECGDTIYMRSSFGARDRGFQVWGVEPRVSFRHDLFGADNEIQAGARFMVDEMTDERNNRTTIAADPLTRDRDVRTTVGYALFVQNKSIFGDRFSITPGARVESYDQERDFDRRSNEDVDYSGETSNTVVLPGLGITYDVAEDATLFAGAHRGFSPPRTGEAIDSSGTDVELDEETSWNYELGLRGGTRAGSWYEATAFVMDFTNQIIPANQSGGAGTALVNAGETMHRGLELAGGLDIGRILAASDLRLSVSGGLTLLRAEFTAGVYDGNDLVYAPSTAGFLRVEVGRDGFAAGIEALYVGDQLADPANTRDESAAGTVGEIPAYTLVNLDGHYQLSKVELFATVQNALDERYVTSRAPEGIFLGAFRQVAAGVRYRF